MNSDGFSPSKGTGKGGLVSSQELEPEPAGGPVIPHKGNQDQQALCGRCRLSLSTSPQAGAIYGTPEICHVEGGTCRGR